VITHAYLNFILTIYSNQSSFFLLLFFTTFFGTFVFGKKELVTELINELFSVIRELVSTIKELLLEVGHSLKDAFWILFQTLTETVKILWNAFSTAKVLSFFLLAMVAASLPEYLLKTK
jgi:hypothetical protein